MYPIEKPRRTRPVFSEFNLVCCGHIVRIDHRDRPYVDFEGNPGQPMLARCLEGVALPADTSPNGHTVLLLFDRGDHTRPIIIGVVKARFGTAPVKGDPKWQTPNPKHALVEGQQVTLKGHTAVPLACGAASITLTNDGRITLRGAEISSRASGSNKIRGASVSIN